MLLRLGAEGPFLNNLRDYSTCEKTHSESGTIVTQEYTVGYNVYQIILVEVSVKNS